MAHYRTFTLTRTLTFEVPGRPMLNIDGKGDLVLGTNNGSGWDLMGKTPFNAFFTDGFRRM